MSGEAIEICRDRTADGGRPVFRREEGVVISAACLLPAAELIGCIDRNGADEFEDGPFLDRH